MGVGGRAGVRGALHLGGPAHSAHSSECAIEEQQAGAWCPWGPTCGQKCEQCGHVWDAQQAHERTMVVLQMCPRGGAAYGADLGGLWHHVLGLADDTEFMGLLRERLFL